MSKITKRLLSLLVVIAMVVAMAPATGLPAVEVKAEEAEATQTTYSQVIVNDAGLGYCPACDGTVTWEVFDGRKQYDNITDHKHLYLAKDTDYTFASANMVRIRGGAGKVCFHLNGYTLTSGIGRFWITSTGTAESVLNIFGQNGYVNYSAASQFVQNNVGTVNIYNGTYTPVNTEAGFAQTYSNFVLQDATVNDNLISASASSLYVLKGATTVGKINLDQNGSELELDASWTGAATLDMEAEELTDGQVPKTKVYYTGDAPTGTLQLVSGEKLGYKDGGLYVRRITTCPVCGYEGVWTRFDGTKAYGAHSDDGSLALTEHVHLYLAKDTEYTFDSANIAVIGAGGGICLDLNGKTLTAKDGRMWLTKSAAADSAINIIGGANGKIVCNGTTRAFIQQNAGYVNIIGGTYTSTGAEKPIFELNNTATIEDATIEGYIDLPSWSSVVTLKGDTNVTGNINFKDGTNQSSVIVDKSFTGSAKLGCTDGLLVGGVFDDTRARANGDFTGTVIDGATGKRLMHKGGDLVASLVADTLTWKELDAIPLANSSMTEDELRQICVDFFRTTLSFAWTPSQTTNLENKGTTTKTFEEGKVYGGTPYVSNTMGTIYTAMEYYDPATGVLDLSGGMDTIKLFSNQCSGASFWAWNRVCTSAKFTYTADTVMKNGCLPVGPYEYDPDLELFDEDTNSTSAICAANGQATMFASYANMKPADGLVTVTEDDGHIYMVSRVDAANQKVYYIDQSGKYQTGTQADNTTFEYLGYEVEISFADLFAKHYIPFTFAEFSDPSKVEESKTTISYTGDNITITDLNGATVTSNYSISDVTITVKDIEGNEVYRNLAPTSKFNTSSPLNLQVPVSNAVEEELAEYADGMHTIEISARIGTGEKPVVYTGTFGEIPEEAQDEILKAKEIAALNPADVIESGECPMCGAKDFQWTRCEGSQNIEADEHAHYYFLNETKINDAVYTFKLNSGTQLCVVLVNNAVVNTAGPFVLTDGDNATLNVMGSGTVTCSATKLDEGRKATISLLNAATANIYGGTYIYSGTENVREEGVIVLNHADAKLNLYNNATIGRAEQDEAVVSRNVFVAKGAAFNMYGGVIRNGNSKNGTYGGNVTMANGGSFNMYGGRIENGCTNHRGGNIYTISGDADCSFTMYGGTISGGKALRGGNIAMDNGGITIYDGIIKDGVATGDAKGEDYGGNIYLAGAATNTIVGGTISGGKAYQGGNIYLLRGQTNITGSTIKGGTVSNTGSELYVRANDGCSVHITGGTLEPTQDWRPVIAVLGSAELENMIINGTVECANNSVIKLSGTTTVETIDAHGEDDYKSTILGTESWTGSANVIDPHVTTFVNGEATSDDTTRSIFANEGTTGKFTVNGIPVIKDGELHLAISKITAVETELYSTWEKALAAYTEADLEAGNYLQASYDATVTLDKDCYIDAAGFEMTVSSDDASVDLYAMDSSNDDFEGAASWNVTGANIVRDTQSAVKGTRYLVITKDGVTSAHALVLELAGAKINTAQVGLSYEAQYKCDDILADMISTYGIIASLQDMPGAKMEDGDARTELHNFQPDDDNHEVLTDSSYIYGIFKSDRAVEKNAQYGQMKIYANPYIELDLNGDEVADVIVGDTENAGEKAGNAWSLYDVLKNIDDNWAANAVQQAAVDAFCSNWKDSVIGYGFTNIKVA